MNVFKTFRVSLAHLLCECLETVADATSSTSSTWVLYTRNSISLVWGNTTSAIWFPDAKNFILLAWETPLLWSELSPYLCRYPYIVAISSDYGIGASESCGNSKSSSRRIERLLKYVQLANKKQRNRCFFCSERNFSTMHKRSWTKP